MNWTPEAENFLKMYYATTDTKELAEALETTVISVRSKAKKLGIKKEASVLPKDQKKCPTCGGIFPREECKAGYCRRCNRERQRLKKIEQNAESKTKEDAEMKAIEEATAKEKYVCYCCGEEKLGTEFYFLKRDKKRSTQCRACKRKISQESEIKGIIAGTRYKK